jgi:protein-S-isoprenylcysteine O-methyltransferase Ste14
LVRGPGAIPERLANVALSAVFIALAIQSIRNAVRFHQPLAAVYFLIHLTVAVAFLTRHRTIERSPYLPGYAAATVATFYVYLYDFSVPPSALARAAAALTLLGAVTTLLAVLSLGRCYGILAVWRGVATRGMYRVVRHPIYASYLLMDTGILLEHPSARNLAVFAVGIAAQLIRIHYEERVLRQSAAYADYAARVRYRLVPLVY